MANGVRLTNIAVLTPTQCVIAELIHLVGQLTQLIALTQNKKSGLKEAGLQVTLVAGAGDDAYQRAALPAPPPRSDVFCG